MTFNSVGQVTCGGAALGFMLFLAMQAAKSLRLAQIRESHRREPVCAEAA